MTSSSAGFIGLTPADTSCRRGGISSAALASDGTVFTFGSGDDGALGRLTTSVLEEGIPMEICEDDVDKEDKRKFVSIKAGDTHANLLSSTGSVYQYGMMKDVDSGKFCIADNHSSCNDCNFHPVKVPGFQQPVKSIESGNSISAAILKDGSLVTWGMLHQNYRRHLEFLLLDFPTNDASHLLSAIVC